MADTTDTCTHSKANFGHCLICFLAPVCFDLQCNKLLDFEKPNLILFCALHIASQMKCILNSTWPSKKGDPVFLDPLASSVFLYSM